MPLRNILNPVRSFGFVCWAQQLYHSDKISELRIAYFNKWLLDPINGGKTIPCDLGKSESRTAVVAIDG